MKKEINKEINKQINKITEVADKAYEVKVYDTEDKKYNSLKQLRDELDVLLGLYCKDDKNKSKIKSLNMLIGECEQSAFGSYYQYSFYTYYTSIVSSIKYYMDKFKSSEN